MDSNTKNAAKNLSLAVPPFCKPSIAVWMERVVHRPELSHRRCPAALGMRLPRSFGRQKGGLSHRGLVGLSTIICTQGVFFKHPRWLRWLLGCKLLNHQPVFSWWFWNKKATKKLGVAWVKFLYKKPFHLGCFVAHMFFWKLPHIIRGAPAICVACRSESLNCLGMLWWIKRMKTGKSQKYAKKNHSNMH